MYFSLRFAEVVPNWKTPYPEPKWQWIDFRHVKKVMESREGHRLSEDEQNLPKALCFIDVFQKHAPKKRYFSQLILGTRRYLLLKIHRQQWAAPFEKWLWNVTSPTVSTCKNRISKPIKSESVDCFLRNLQPNPQKVCERVGVFGRAGGAELLKEAADPATVTRFISKCCWSRLMWKQSRKHRPGLLQPQLHRTWGSLCLFCHHMIKGQLWVNYIHCF